ncbi:hypothetical protein [Methylocaldum sp.]|uniref:hypothetical protein n=1 Tax=Methylocaldum sp. TaxID=1969727 RepID=UPI002D248EA6|nr:hypothetical protein [Methylocaldum sp.]HYE37087.1 hypothetical protein [Methylocaldum sp.]
MPSEVESLEQGVAWVTWCLDDHSPKGMFEPASPIPWLAVGRQNRHLLPWEKERAAYAARPHCTVERAWARLALNTLAEKLNLVGEKTMAIFDFDGSVLRISCGETVIAMPADGLPWTQPFSIAAGLLRNLPKRLMTSAVEFSIWDSALQIGNRRYRGVIAGECEMSET